MISFKVRRKIIHPKFKYRVTQPDRYDVALLELSKSAGQGFHIYPICLPEAGTRMAGRQAIVSGWGKIKPSNELTGTNVLRSAVVPILGETEIINICDKSAWFFFRCKRMYVVA